MKPRSAGHLHVPERPLSQPAYVCLGHRGLTDPYKFGVE